MTSLSSPARPARTSPAEVASRRPLVLVTTLGGAAAAGSVLLVCLAIGVVGWFLTDAGAHGAPHDGLRVATLGWLMGHGSGVEVRGTPVTAVPLGVTVVVAWVMWRFALRVGESISGHGPDADAISDGERDWTVPIATLLYGAGYAAVAVVAFVLATDPTTGGSLARVFGWVAALTLLVAGPAIAIGSGRAAIWAAMMPVSLRAAVTTAAAILVAFLGAAAVAVVVGLALDFATAASVLSRLHTDPGEAVLYALVTAAVTPNAIGFAGAYLLGPGFTVGTHTLVAPTLVVLGPVPAFPLLAALPDEGPTSPWTVMVLGAPFMIAAVVAARAHRRFPTLRWDEGALRGCAGGLLAGAGFGLFALISGGAVGPGRMAHVAPLAFDALVHGLAIFGLGGLVGGLAMTFWARRRASRQHR